VSVTPLRDRSGETDVGDEDLTSTATLHPHTTAHLSTVAPSVTATATEATFKAAPCWCACTACTACTTRGKARLCLAILGPIVNATSKKDRRIPYLANVDQATHEVLVAERIDSRLCLLPCGIFNNAGGSWSVHGKVSCGCRKLTRIPISPDKGPTVNYCSTCQPRKARGPAETLVYLAHSVRK